MIPGAPLAVWLAARVVLGVASSALQKRLLDRGMEGPRIWSQTYRQMLAPALLVLAVCWQDGAGSTFWIPALLSGALDAAGNLFMIAALRGSDLSVFGPLTAFRPVLALLFGAVFLGERPTTWGMLGVLVTVAGAGLLSAGAGRGGSGAGITAGAFLLRLSGLALSTFAAVFLKRAAVAANPEMTLGVWIAAGGCAVGIAGFFDRTRKDAAAGERSADRPPSTWPHAATFLAMQWLTIHVFVRGPLAYSFAFFQAAMVLQVVVGRVFFGEPAFGRRISGCLAMGAGVALIGWKG